MRDGGANMGVADSGYMGGASMGRSSGGSVAHMECECGEERGGGWRKRGREASITASTEVPQRLVGKVPTRTHYPLPTTHYPLEAKASSLY